MNLNKYFNILALLLIWNTSCGDTTNDENLDQQNQSNTSSKNNNNQQTSIRQLSINCPSAEEIAQQKVAKQQWIDSVKTNEEDIKLSLQNQIDSIRSNKDIGDISYINSGFEKYIFQLNKYPDIFFKMYKNEADIKSIVQLEDDNARSEDIIDSNNLNCLYVPAHTLIYFTVKGARTEIPVFLQQKQDVSTSHEWVRDEYESSYMQMETDSSIRDRFKDIFEQQGEFTCMSGFWDQKFDNMPLSKQHNQIVLLDIEKLPPRGANVQERLNGFYLLLNPTQSGGDRPSDNSLLHVSVAHQSFFDEIFSSALTCSGDPKGNYFESTLGNVDKNNLTVLKQKRTEQFNFIKGFDKWLQTNNIEADTKIDILTKINQIDTTKLHKLASAIKTQSMKRALNAWIKQGIDDNKSLDTPLWNKRIFSSTYIDSATLFNKLANDLNLDIKNRNHIKELCDNTRDKLGGLLRLLKESGQIYNYDCRFFTPNPDSPEEGYLYLEIEA